MTLPQTTQPVLMGGQRSVIYDSAAGAVVFHQTERYSHVPGLTFQRFNYPWMLRAQDEVQRYYYGHHLEGTLVYPLPIGPTQGYEVTYPPSGSYLGPPRTPSLSAFSAPQGRSSMASYRGEFSGYIPDAKLVGRSARARYHVRRAVLGQDTAGGSHAGSEFDPL